MAVRRAPRLKRGAQPAPPTIPEVPAVVETPPVPGNRLAPDLQVPIDATFSTMQERAKLVRQAFSKRGWPNEEHPGTVRDFLDEHGIPYI